MRNFTISKLFASVITRVIDVVAANGIAIRSFRLTSMCEHMGHRFEQCQGSLVELLQGDSQPGYLQFGNKRPELQRPALALAYGIAAQSVCPAPRLSQARASWRG